MGKVMVEKAVGMAVAELRALVEDRYAMADRVVIDTGPGATEYQKTTIQVADFVVVVMNPAEGAAQGAEVLERVCQASGKECGVVENCGDSFPEVDGVKKILRTRQVPDDFRYALEDVVEWIGTSQVVGVVGGKGGVGKTTIAAALALFLAHERGENVLILDMDDQVGCITNVLQGKESAKGDRVKWDGFREEAPAPVRRRLK